MNRKDLHNNFEKNMTHDTLSNAFLNDVESKFNNNLVKQWFSDKLLPLTLAAVLLVSKYFFHWLLNAPIEDFCVASDLRKDNIHLPLLKPFITKEASLEKIKKTMFLPHMSFSYRQNSP